MGEHVMRRYVKTSDLSRLMKEDEWPTMYVTADPKDPRVQPVTIRFGWAEDRDVDPAPDAGPAGDR